MIEDGEIYTLQIDGQNKTEMENTIRKDKLNQFKLLNKLKTETNLHPVNGCHCINDYVLIIVFIIEHLEP